MTDIQTGFAPVNDTQLYYEIQGKGEPLVLLHAGLVDCRMWDEQFSALAEHVQVIRYDAQGFGRSEAANGRYAHYQNLAALLTYLNIAPAHLLGCSLGGRAVLDCALEYPHLVRSLICVDTGMSGYHFVDPFVQTTGEEIGRALAAGHSSPAGAHPA